MNEIKIFANGGLNYDTELHLMPKDDWVDAINVRIAASDQQFEASAYNIEGNVRIGNYSYGAGANKCIGAYADEFRNVIYACICNINNLDEIIEINPETGVITPVFKNIVWTNGVDVTQWEPWIKIHSINVINRADDEGDLFFWTNGDSRPRKINIKRAKAFGTPDGYPSPILTSYTLVAKEPPPAPTLEYFSDFTRIVNNIRGRLFQFQIRYVYDDFEKSTWSGWASFEIPPQPFTPDRDADPAINNGIILRLFTAGEIVKKIEIAVRQNIGSVWGDAYLFETIDKAEDSVSDDVVYAFSFYNDTIGVIQPNTEVNQVWDFVPTKAGSQALINGNTIAYGDITEGIRFDGALNVTTTVAMNLLDMQAGDCFLTWKLHGKYRLGLVYFDEFKRTDGVHTYVAQEDSDDDFEITIPYYQSNNDATDDYSIYTPTVNASIHHQPPIWARTFRWVRTPCLTYTKFFYYILRLHNTADPDNMYFEIDPMVSSILYNGQNVISYGSFTPGDRCRLLRKMASLVPPDTFPGFLINVDLEILNLVKDPKVITDDLTGTFLVVRRNTITDLYGSALFLAEIYNPLVNGNNSEFFYEFDKEYAILNPDDPINIAHAGMNQDQIVSSDTPATFSFSKGDVYVRERERMDYKNPESAFHLILRNIPVLDPNFSDKYDSAVNGNGRAYIVDDNQKEQRIPSLIRFGGSYIQDTFINKTNNFPAENLVDDCSRAFGAIKRMTIRDRQLRVFQELKCGWIPVSQTVLKTTSGESVVSQSDQLLNNIQYYEGDFGIGNAPCSLASKNFADYFHDTNRGVICRLSRDGLTPISITGKINRFAIVEDVKYKSTVYLGAYPASASDIPGRAQIYGVFDTKSNEYISSYEEIAEYPDLERTVVNTPKTIAWDEVRNRFSSRRTYYPEWMTALKNDIITFKNGLPYIHNDKINRCRFYGANNEWSLEVVFNDRFAVKKTFQGIDQLSNKPIPCPVIYTSLFEFDTVTQQSSNLIESDFTLLEGHYHATLLRDSNSPGGIVNGDLLKGSYLKVQLKKDQAQSLLTVYSVAMLYIISNLNNK